MEQIVSVCEMISPTESSVMLLGESGVGKEILARYIHQHSNRSGENFVAINCAAIPKDLFEAEFFGYEPHSFTGASDYGKDGLIKLADNGTLFLDEIAEMPMDMQTKLLRCLNDGEIYPVGSTSALKVNVRVISATNRDIFSMVQNKQFRLDLYYRLNVIPVRIPPLRERLDDLKLLAEYYLCLFNKKYDRNEELSEKDIGALMSYSWPGNIRELCNIIERIVVLKKGGNVQDIFEGVAGYEISQGESKTDNFNIPPVYSLKSATVLFQNHYIQAVLNSADGIVGAAANILEIHRSTLYRKIS